MNGPGEPEEVGGAASVEIALWAVVVAMFLFAAARSLGLA